MEHNKSDPILFHIQRDPLAFVFSKNGQRVVIPFSVEVAQILAFELLEIPEVGRNFSQVAEALVLQKLQLQHMASESMSIN